METEDRLSPEDYYLKTEHQYKLSNTKNRENKDLKQQQDL